MQTLPIDAVLPDIRTALSQSSQVILQAPPGAGKTTKVPLELLDEPWLRDKMIVMLEPRRLAARSSASRMADLLGEKLGDTVGYHIRREKKAGEKTRILVVTEGILTRLLQSDPALERIGLVIFDEFHERSIHADLALALCLQSQALLRDDLKLLIMSATLDTPALARLLPDAPVIRSEGRCYPVETFYLPESTQPLTAQTLVPHTAKLITELLAKKNESILVFLPGAREIKGVEAALKTSAPRDVHIAPLYGALSKEEQTAAIAPSSTRKVVLATNIAETSLTIEGITLVIDSGLERRTHFHTGHGMDRLETLFICHDSATQRLGRAGRTAPGACHRLWHAGRILEPHASPEILQSDLTPLLLDLAHWGAATPDELDWVDAPPAEAVRHATELLASLDAIDPAGRITEHGRAILSLGIHPRLAHMILAAKNVGLAYEACCIAAILEERDIFTQAENADLRERLEALERPGAYATDPHRLRQVKENIRDLAARLEIGQKTLDIHAAGLLLSLAYPDRIAVRRGERDGWLLASGKGAKLRQNDPLARSPYLACADLDGSGKEARIYLAAPVEKAELLRHHAAHIAQTPTLRWNKEAGRVEGGTALKLGAIVLEEKKELPKGEALAAMLLEGIRSTGLSALPWNEKAKSLQMRVNFLRLHQSSPRLQNLELPDLSDETLLSTLEAWLAPHIEGFGSLAQCQGLDLYGIFSVMMPWENLQLIDRFAPEKLTVPSGSAIRIDYADPKTPILAVRLQEMFGQRTTPAVIEGEVPLLIHLLSPAHRPMQVTRDLESFWQNAYVDVKKELRGKYKKHYWPDDPLTAQATSKTKKNM